MISSTNFKAHFHQLFRVMKDTGMYVDVHFRGHAYRIHVEDLHHKIDRQYKKKSYVSEIQTSDCPHCKKLMVNGVCMNPTCPSLKA